MTGYVAMARDWQDDAFFGSDEFSRRDAWAWLVAHAAWKPTSARVKGSRIELHRGELCFSQRFLAEKWGWSKSRVDRFIANLRDEGIIETRSKIGATAGHSAGQGQSIITICKYAKYQDSDKTQRGNDDAEIGATAGQQRGKEEPRNQETIEPEEEVTAPSAADYAFSGRVIRLTQSDLDQWVGAYPDVDVPARLQSRDDWLAFEAADKDRSRWFIPTSNWLSKLQQESKRAKRAAENEPVWDGMP